MTNLQNGLANFNVNSHAILLPQFKERFIVSFIKDSKNIDMLTKQVVAVRNIVYDALDSSKKTFEVVFQDSMISAFINELKAIKDSDITILVKLVDGNFEDMKRFKFNNCKVSHIKFSDLEYYGGSQQTQHIILLDKTIKYIFSKLGVDDHNDQDFDINAQTISNDWINDGTCYHKVTFTYSDMEW